MFTRGRGFEALAGTVTLGFVLWSASTACKITPGPSSPCGSSSTDLNCAPVYLVATADGPFTIQFNGLSDSLIDFPRNKLLWDAAFYMVLGTIWFYWVGRVLQMLFRWATNRR